MPFGFHPAYMVILLVVVLIIFGPGKLPDLGGAVGRGLREFNKARDEITGDIAHALERQGEEKATTAATATSPATEAYKPPAPKSEAPDKK